MEIDIKTLRELGYDCFHTGSREICDPFPLDTDDDYLVTVKDNTSLQFIHNLLTVGGWNKGGSEYNNNPGFWSWRRAEVNVLTTANHEYSEKFKLATRVAKALNVLKKAERIQLFEAIVYQTDPLHEPGRDLTKFLKKDDPVQKQEFNIVLNAQVARLNQTVWDQMIQPINLPGIKIIR